MTSHFSLRGQRKLTKRKATPMSCPNGYPRYCFISFGTRIRTPVLMHSRYIHVAQPRNKTTSRQTTRGLSPLNQKKNEGVPKTNSILQAIQKLNSKQQKPTSVHGNIIILVANKI